MIRKSMAISFGEYDLEIYNYLKKQKNASALVRYLVLKHMNGECTDNITIKPNNITVHHEDKIEKNTINTLNTDDKVTVNALNGENNDTKLSNLCFDDE